MKRFIQNIMILIAVGFFAGMAIMTWEGNQTPPQVDAQLQPYVDQWKSDMDSAGVSYEWNRLDYIRLVDRVPEHLLGGGDPMRAGFADKASRSVYIRWDSSYTAVHIKVIVYHELAHYLLGVEDHMTDGEILGSRLIRDPDHYSDNWSILLTNYINRAKDE